MSSIALCLPGYTTTRLPYAVSVNRTTYLGIFSSLKAEFIVNMLQTRSDSGADGDKRRRPEAECSNSPPKSFVKYFSCNN